MSKNQNIVYYLGFLLTFLFIHGSPTHKKVGYTQISFWISVFIYQNCRSTKWSILPTAQSLLHVGRTICLSETFLPCTGLPQRIPSQEHIMRYAPLTYESTSLSCCQTTVLLHHTFAPSNLLPSGLMYKFSYRSREMLDPVEV